MKYKCVECGAVFEEPATYKEYQGEYLGVPAYESMTGCPICHGGYNEVPDFGGMVDGLIRIKDNHNLSRQEADLINNVCDLLEDAV